VKIYGQCPFTSGNGYGTIEDKLRKNLISAQYRICAIIMHIVIIIAYNKCFGKSMERRTISFD